MKGRMGGTPHGDRGQRNQARRMVERTDQGLVDGLAGGDSVLPRRMALVIIREGTLEAMQG
jgi:hypothetical protein